LNCGLLEVVPESLTNKRKRSALFEIEEGRRHADWRNGRDVTAVEEPEEVGDDAVVDQHVAVVDTVVWADEVLEVAAEISVSQLCRVEMLTSCSAGQCRPRALATCTWRDLGEPNLPVRGGSIEEA